MCKQLKKIIRKLFTGWNARVWFLSCEWILTCVGIPNGGSVILVRSFFSAVVLLCTYVGLSNVLDPSRAWVFSFKELQVQVSSMFSSFGLIIGAVYTALYTRFASQTAYLSDVYNQIKNVECQTSSDGERALRLAEWKAGFIEGAEIVHLALKPLFASVIRAWAEDSSVSDAYARTVKNGQRRLENLLGEIKDIDELKSHRKC